MTMLLCCYCLQTTLYVCSCKLVTATSVPTLVNNTTSITTSIQHVWTGFYQWLLMAQCTSVYRLQLMNTRFFIWKRSDTVYGVLISSMYFIYESDDHLVGCLGNTLYKYRSLEWRPSAQVVTIQPEHDTAMCKLRIDESKMQFPGDNVADFFPPFSVTHPQSQSQLTRHREDKSPH